ncbi:DUF2489 domain-containing protein [Glaciecola sp. SC05]|uniref:DUF2489 domain-containing protein n=1 Tax=Glaciecola sp. SC05 TaxID=1987355 RepID=UPI00352852DA
MVWTLAAVGAVVIVVLSVYAGRLLFLLQAQKSRHQVAKQKRIDDITESIQTIAFAMHQQQCDLSEGTIRICRLLEAMPLDPLPDFKQEYPAIHSLFDKVKNYPTHEERNALSKAERRGQDKERGQFESELESSILHETEKLKSFTV